MDIRVHFFKIKVVTVIELQKDVQYMLPLSSTHTKYIRVNKISLQKSKGKRHFPCHITDTFLVPYS